MKKSFFAFLFLLVFVATLAIVSPTSSFASFWDDFNEEDIDHIAGFNVDISYFPIEPDPGASYTSAPWHYLYVNTFYRNPYDDNVYLFYRYREPYGANKYSLIRVEKGKDYYVKIYLKNGDVKEFRVRFNSFWFVYPTLNEEKFSFFKEDDNYYYYLGYSTSYRNFFQLPSAPLPTPTPIPDTYTIRYFYEDPYTGEDLFPNDDFIFAYDFDPFANGSFELAIDGFVFPEWFPVYGSSSSGLTVFYKDTTHVLIYPPVKYREGDKHYVVYIPIIRNITDYRKQGFDFSNIGSFGTEFFDSVKLLTQFSWKNYWFLWLIPVVGLVVLFVYKN